MIPKIIQGRRDKKSSIKQLITYISNKPSESLADPVQPTPETVSAISDNRFDKLTDYLIRRNQSDNEAIEVTPGTYRQEIGDVTCQYNTFSLSGSASEMEAVANQNTNPNAKNKIMHYVLSWPEHELPEADKVFESVEFTLKSMGLENHQYVSAIHRDTDNLHVHVAVNRVNPETYKLASDAYSKDTLHRACRILELKNNWSHTHGAYVINDKLDIVRNPEKAPGRNNANSLDAITKMEQKGGTETLFSYVTGGRENFKKSANYTHLVSTLNDANSWDELHKGFSDLGLTLRHSESHPGLVITHEEKGKTTAIKASLVLSHYQYEYADLTERLGKFEPSRYEPKSVAITGMAYSNNGYKRDANKRAQQKLARAEQRLLLKGRYRNYLNNLPTYKVDRELQSRRMKEVHAHTRLVKANIRRDVRDPQLRKLMYNLAEFKRMQRLAELRVEGRENRDGFKAANPRLTYRDWVEQEALKGDAAAISQMRGFAYAQSKSKKHSTALQAVTGFENIQNSILMAGRDDVAPIVSEKQKVMPVLLRDGSIIYHDEQDSLVLDKGNVLFVDTNKRDDRKAENVAVALTLTGGTQNVLYRGQGSFKQYGIDRTVTAAVTANNADAKQISFYDEQQNKYAKEKEMELKGNGNDSKNVSVSNDDHVKSNLPHRTPR